MSSDFAELMPVVAEKLLGEPNRALSKGNELRFGTHGSLAVDSDKGVWHDHEANEGGGVIDLVRRETGRANGSAMDWLRGEGFIDGEPRKKQVVETYDYHDEAGDLLSQVVRFVPKDFRQRKPDGRGGWDWKVKGVRKVPYRLPAVIEAVKTGETVYIVEGEKDCDRLADMGIVATCNAGGAGKWTGEHSKHFNGAQVVLLPDNDDAGRSHVEAAASSLKAAGAASVKVLALPGLPQKGDVSDWLASGGTAENLAALEKSLGEPDARPPRRTLTWAADCRGSEPPPSIIKGVIAEGNFFVAYGAPKATKSFAMLDAGYHVAKGHDWFGRKVKQGGVLVVCAERGAVMKRRLDALLRHNRDASNPPLAIIDGSFSLYSTPDDVQDVIDAANEVKRVAGSIRMIVLDTLAKANAGADDVSDMPKMLGPVAKMQGAFPEAAIVAIHHTNAEEGSRKMRGRSDLRGAIDGALLVEKTDTGSVATLVDSNDAADPFEVYYQIENVNLGFDEDGEAFGSGVVVPTEAKARKPKSKKLAGREKVAFEALLEAIRKHGTLSSSPDLPGQKKLVPLENWRDECDRSGLVDSDNQDSHRRVFNRCKLALINADLVRVCDGFAWPIDDTGTSGTTAGQGGTNPSPMSGTDGTGTIVPVPAVPMGASDDENLIRDEVQI